MDVRKSDESTKKMKECNNYTYWLVIMLCKYSIALRHMTNYHIIPYHYHALIVNLSQNCPQTCPRPVLGPVARPVPRSVPDLSQDLSWTYLRPFPRPVHGPVPRCVHGPVLNLS